MQKIVTGHSMAQYFHHLISQYETLHWLSQYRMYLPNFAHGFQSVNFWCHIGNVDFTHIHTQLFHYQRGSHSVAPVLMEQPWRVCLE